MTKNKAEYTATRVERWTDGRTDGRTNKAGCKVTKHATKNPDSFQSKGGSLLGSSIRNMKC